MGAFSPTNLPVTLNLWKKGMRDAITGKPDVPALAKPPPAAPDITDAAVQSAKSAEILRSQMGRGRKSTFLTGPGGLTAPAPTAKTKLGGY